MSGLRVCLVLAAFFLVAAVALATLLPVDEPLSQVLVDWDAHGLAALQRAELRWLGAYAWRFVTVPLLVRPAWLPALAAGLVSGGAAMSLGWARATRPRARRF